MSNPHFGKFADVWKHLPLLDVLRIEQPGRYWETHAGSALYPLTRSPERNFGIYWFLDHADAEPVLNSSVYHALLSDLEQEEGYPGRYPGSAMLAMLALGRGAEYLFCDADESSITDLRAAAESADLDDHVYTVLGDGPGTISRAMLQLSDADQGEVMCHLDPFSSFEAESGSPSALELFQHLSLGGCRVAYWYGYEGEREQGWLLSQISEPIPVWCGDMLLPQRDESGLLGCGVALTNVSSAAIERCSQLGGAVERIYRNAALPGGGVGSVRFREFQQG